MTRVCRYRFFREVFVSFLVSLVFMGNLLAQVSEDTHGYIISYSGDTTFGQISPGNYFRDQKRIRFTDVYGVKTIYHSDRIAGFGYGGKHYIAKPTPYYFAGLFSDSTIFLLRRIQGPASLYRFYKQRSLFTLQKGPSYFELVEKPDGKLYEVSLAFKWKRVATVFADYPELAREIETGLYKPEELDKIIDTYNQWYNQR
ncbi:MAG: hypothetical protein R3D00_24900 [Bacteroidia bacterium]